MNHKHIDHIGRMPLVAILRGITPQEAVDISDVLVDAGFYFIEITLDSYRWETSMQKIKQKHGDRILLGAGTVLSPQDVDRVHESGGQAVISPNCSVSVIQQSKARGLISIPGCYTPTECFVALQAGADMLKVFPANTLGVDYIKSLAVVLPDNTRLCPTGGIDADNAKSYLTSGAYAVGIGSSLYYPGISIKQITDSAQQLTRINQQT